MSKKRNYFQAAMNAAHNRLVKMVMQQRRSYIHWNFYAASPSAWPCANRAEALKTVTQMAIAQIPL